MTIAGKINALVLGIAVVAGCLLTATTLFREYALARERLVKQSHNSIQSQPQLQVAMPRETAFTNCSHLPAAT